MQQQTICFNSLQTGRSFRTPPNVDAVVRIPLWFQFPSNGKVFPNSLELWCIFGWRPCFNSLQTGRSFRTEKEAGSLGISGRQFCFNSLQTGRTSSTQDLYLCPSMGCHRVSIPFKREGLPQQYNFEKNWGTRLFQFPSNGKDFLNSGSWQAVMILFSTGFNSLQTGRTSSTTMSF